MPGFVIALAEMNVCEPIRAPLGRFARHGEISTRGLDPGGQGGFKDGQFVCQAAVSLASLQVPASQNGG